MRGGFVVRGGWYGLARSRLRAFWDGWWLLGTFIGSMRLTYYFSTHGCRRRASSFLADVFELDAFAAAAFAAAARALLSKKLAMSIDYV